MNLTEALAHQPVERLRQIVSQRRIVFRSQVKDRGELIDGLAQVLGANAHPWNVLSLLDRAELHLLRTLAKTSGEIVDGRQLRNAFPNGMPKDELRRIVASLGDKGMLLPVNNDQYYLPRPISRAFASEGNSTNLRSCLLQLQVSQLQQLCAQFNCPAQPARKNDLVDRLCTALSRPATAKALVEALPAPARKLFDVLFAASGPLTVDRLLQEVPRDRRSHVRYYWQWGPYTYMGVGDNELVQIQRSGLAYAPNGPRLPTLLVIPDEIRWAVQGRPEQSIAQFLPPSAETPAAGTTFRSHDTLLPDIVRALVFLQQERPEALKSGGFPKQALRKLSQKLTVTDVNYGGFV
ncbi:MAG: hypothetical protein KGJ86_18210, partial [Chloroflexota bacterium]|nr:hypothetical protein [Chloroflexota bacterium]